MNNVTSSSFKKTTVKWTIATLAFTIVVGCSNLSNPIKPNNNSQNQQGTTVRSPQNDGANTSSSASSSTATSASNSGNNSSNPSTPVTTAPATQLNPDSMRTMLLNMMVFAKQGKVINSDFPAKTTTIDDVEKAWGKANQTNYVAAAKGSYATFSNHKVVFGFNKGNQIFEVRSFDSRLGSITLAKVKEVLGTPAYDTRYNSQEVIGYTAGPEFKFEMVFPQPTTSNLDPIMDHYSVLYPQGTVNSMADDPGRQW